MDSLPYAMSTIIVIRPSTGTEVSFYLVGVEILKEVCVKTLRSRLGVANLRKVILGINQSVIHFNFTVLGDLMVTLKGRKSYTMLCDDDPDGEA